MAYNAEVERKKRARRYERARSEGIPARVKHGTTGAYSNWRCRCEPCVAANDEHNARTKQRAKAGQIKHRTGGYNFSCTCESCRAKRAAIWSRLNSESLDGATHHGEEWTGPQLEVVASGRYTDKELTKILGRSLYSITTIQHRLRHDPKIMRLAGLAVED